jgi:hypothetical protein
MRKRMGKVGGGEMVVGVMEGGIFYKIPLRTFT